MGFRSERRHIIFDFVNFPNWPHFLGDGFILITLICQNRACGISFIIDASDSNYVAAKTVLLLSSVFTGCPKTKIMLVVTVYFTASSS